MKTRIYAAPAVKGLTLHLVKKRSLYLYFFQTVLLSFQFHQETSSYKNRYNNCNLGGYMLNIVKIFFVFMPCICVKPDADTIQKK